MCLSVCLFGSKINLPEKVSRERVGSNEYGLDSAAQLHTSLIVNNILVLIVNRDIHFFILFREMTMDSINVLAKLFLHKDPHILFERIFSFMSADDCSQLSNKLRQFELATTRESASERGDMKSNILIILRHLTKCLNTPSSKQYWRLRVNRLKAECYVYGLIADMMPRGIPESFNGYCELHKRRNNIVSGTTRTKCTIKIPKTVNYIRLGSTYLVQSVRLRPGTRMIEVYKIIRSAGKNPSFQKLDASSVNKVWTARDNLQNDTFLFDFIEPFLIIPDGGQFTVFTLSDMAGSPPAIVTHSQLHSLRMPVNNGVIPSCDNRPLTSSIFYPVVTVDTEASDSPITFRSYLIQNEIGSISITEKWAVQIGKRNYAEMFTDFTDRNLRNQFPLFIGDEQNVMVLIYRKPEYTDSLDVETDWNRSMIQFDINMMTFEETNIHDYDMYDNSSQISFVNKTPFLLDLDRSDFEHTEWRLFRVFEKNCWQIAAIENYEDWFYIPKI